MIVNAKSKKYIVHLTAVLLSVAFVGAYYYFTRAVSSNQVQFTADVNLSLSGVGDGALQVSSGSSCASLSISGASFTANSISSGELFALKTSSHSNAIKVQPTGNSVSLTVSGADLSGGGFSRWTLSSSGDVTVTNIIGVPNANTKYDIKIDNSYFSSFTSDSNREISFNYAGAGSRVFTISDGSATGGGGGGLPSSPPTPPPASPSNPTGDFQVIIPEQPPAGEEEQTQAGQITSITTTTNRIITLRLLAGPDVKTMAISEDPNFINADIIPYQETYKWTLSKGFGEKTIYVKFFTEFGVPSKVISVKVFLTAPKKPVPTTVPVPVDLAPIKPGQEPEPVTATTTIITPSKPPVILTPMPPKAKPDKIERKIGITSNAHELIYKGLAGTYYGYLSERAVIKVKSIINNIKNGIINSFNIFAEIIDKITPKFIKNAVNTVQIGYDIIVSKIKYEILRFVLK